MEPPNYPREVVGSAVTLAVLIFQNNFMNTDHSSSSDSEEDELYIINYAVARGSKPSRILNFVEVTVLNFTDREFQSHFRITRETFHHLLGLLYADLSNVHDRGRATILPEKQLLAVLWLLATPDSYRSVGCRFDLGKSSLSHCFFRVIKALNKIAPNVIKWPSEETRRNIAQRFYQLAHMRGVVGAVDGTYVSIKAPQQHPQAYINRKCFYGITLQAVCDDKRFFLDCYTGWPSSVSDVRIFRNSDIYRSVTPNPQVFFEEQTYIIGDKAYPSLTWCVPPYIQRGQLLQHQINFNRRHAQTRQVIERAFALLFGRFRRLRFLDMNCTDLIPATIVAMCVLHNICLSRPDEFLCEYEQEGLPFVVGEDEENHDGALNVNLQQGRLFREQMARNL